MGGEKETAGGESSASTLGYIRIGVPIEKVANQRKRDGEGKDGVGERNL